MLVCFVDLRRVLVRVILCSVFLVPASSTRALLIIQSRFRYFCYLPDILLVSNVLVELATRDQDSTSENLTQGQKNWLNKKF